MFIMWAEITFSYRPHKNIRSMWLLNIGHFRVDELLCFNFPDLEDSMLSLLSTTEEGSVSFEPSFAVTDFFFGTVCLTAQSRSSHRFTSFCHEY
ncbi:hypothetical protein AB6A40_010385 [Gnathostoma spinigerum]|uniref:Uncharacterized protein n=1 Tax=Gnathostoma spinigerum TaxID=75299 RepID=A0ABD6EUX5_9BILA